MLKLNIINAKGLSKHCGKRLNNETFKIIIIKKKHGCGHRSLRTQEKLAKFRSLMTAPEVSRYSRPKYPGSWKMSHVLALLMNSAYIAEHGDDEQDYALTAVRYNE